MVVIASLGDRVYADEQSEFRCNTGQLGCNNVCFNKFSPISHIRFWGFQLVACSLPSVVFIIYSGHKTSQSMEQEAEQRKQDKAKRKEAKVSQNRQTLFNYIQAISDSHAKANNILPGTVGTGSNNNLKKSASGLNLGGTTLGSLVQATAGGAALAPVMPFDLDRTKLRDELKELKEGRKKCPTSLDGSTCVGSNVNNNNQKKKNLNQNCSIHSNQNVILKNVNFAEETKDQYIKCNHKNKKECQTAIPFCSGLVKKSTKLDEDFSKNFSQINIQHLLLNTGLDNNVFANTPGKSLGDISDEDNYYNKVRDSMDDAALYDDQMAEDIMVAEQMDMMKYDEMADDLNYAYANNDPINDASMFNYNNNNNRDLEQIMKQQGQQQEKKISDRKGRSKSVVKKKGLFGIRVTKGQNQNHSALAAGSSTSMLETNTRNSASSLRHNWSVRPVIDTKAPLLVDPENVDGPKDTLRRFVGSSQMYNPNGEESKNLASITGSLTPKPPVQDASSQLKSVKSGKESVNFYHNNPSFERSSPGSDGSQNMTKIVVTAPKDRPPVAPNQIIDVENSNNHSQSYVMPFKFCFN